MSLYQHQQWTGKFGKEYTDRNVLTPTMMDKLYEKNYGMTRTELNEEFIGNLNRNARVLEVGCGTGTQLKMLQKIGFKNLYGVELQDYAVHVAKMSTTGINIIQGSVFDMPFSERYFDLVFTSGLLIHIPPGDLSLAIRNIQMRSRKYLWGFEYYSKKCEEVEYRGETKLLWKNDFVSYILDHFPSWSLMKEKRIKYLNGNNVDSMFVLEWGAH